MFKLGLRVNLTAIGIIALVIYVSAPIWLSSEIMKRLDVVALGLIVFAALPWLAYCLEELEIGGFKAKLRAIGEQAETASETASTVREMVDELAISGSTFSQRHGTLDLSQSGLEASATKPGKEDPIEELKELAKEYVSIRGSMPSGSERTAKMTAIFGQLESVARELGLDRTEVANWLSQEDAGRQLAAIAWLRAHPDQIKPVGLIAMVDKSNQPFVQYWALRVLKRHVDRKGIMDFSPHDLRQLKELEAQIRRGTDRYFQLRRINEQLDSAS